MELPVEDGDRLRTIPGPGEQSVALTGDFRLIQPKKGHRTSVDDMLVAHLACVQSGAPRRVLDLGCGLGSVLLMVAWARRTAQLVGVEAEPKHVSLAWRNVLVNGCQDRAHIVKGDLRDASLIGGLGTFDLVLGTPPYFEPGSGTMCSDPLRAAAQWELRGGIEDYAHAAAQTLSPTGLFVTCAAAAPPERAAKAFERAGLALRSKRQVLPRTGKPPFLTLLVGSLAASDSAVEEPPLLLRHLDGIRSREHIEIREWFGVPASIR